MRLPWAIRRTILRQVCGDIATGASGWSLVDYPAVQHFASEDLVADLKDLIAEHSKSDDVAAFLLRMVWLGELRDALPEVKTFAFSATLSIYTRVEALRAMTAIGSEQDMEELRAFFLHNGSQLDRTCLAELLDGTEPTPMVAEWLLACLAKTEAKEPFSVDDLSEVLLRFVGRAPVDLLPTIVFGLKSLHDSSSTGKLRDDQLSRTYGWLLDAAGHAVVRLIEARHIASLACDSLAILHRLSAYERNHHSECGDVIARLSAVVPEWAQINRASFWHSALMALEEAENSKREPPTEFWQLRVYGAFWRFDASDFEYALAQVTERSHPQERHLALSLAFHLYVLDGRGRKRRELLKRAVRGDVECEQRLSRYLKPPAQGRQGWKQFEIRQKRRFEARKRKEAQNREAWRVTLQEEVNKLRQNGLPPGEISNDQFYLHERMCENESRSSRWTNGNWKALCREFGGDVARQSHLNPGPVLQAA